jgi:hypothetical protein
MNLDGIFCSAENQIQQHLLQLNAVGDYGRKGVCQVALEQDSILVELTADECQHLLNHLVDVQSGLCGRRLRDECANPRDDGARMSAGGHDVFKSPTQYLTCESTFGEQSQARAAVFGHGGQRLVHFMGDGRRDFAHGGQPGHARKLPLRHLQGVLCVFPIQRDGSLRGQQFQHDDPRGSKDVGSCVLVLSFVCHHEAGHKILFLRRPESANMLMRVFIVYS